jgi:hypothetical protein
MANYISIKNKTKQKPIDILKSVKLELKSKFNLNSSIKYYKRSGGMELFVNGFCFVMWYRENEIALYESVTTAFNRANNENKENKLYFHAFDVRFPRSVYNFLYEYIMNFIADQNSSKVEKSSWSDKPFRVIKSHPDRFESYEVWFKYCEDFLKKEPKLIRAYKGLVCGSKKTKKIEFKYFPELAFLTKKNT